MALKLPLQDSKYIQGMFNWTMRFLINSKTVHNKDTCSKEASHDGAQWLPPDRTSKMILDAWGSEKIWKAKQIH